MCSGDNIQLLMYIQNLFLDLRLDFRKIISDLDIASYSIWRVTVPQAYEGPALNTGCRSPSMFLDVSDHSQAPIMSDSNTCTWSCLCLLPFLFSS